MLGDNMGFEYEIRILEVNVDAMVQKIDSLGGVKVGDWFQKRYVYDTNPRHPSKWFRLRTNGEDIYKEVYNINIDDIKELKFK